METIVYVIENKQPYINWYGTLKSYNLKTRTCVVENYNGVKFDVHLDDCTEADSGLKLIDFLAN